MLPARSFCALGSVVRFVAHNALASVSSLNEQSFEFHRTSGFECCGTSSGLGWKAGCDFDIVWFLGRLWAEQNSRNLISRFQSSV
jgi:L-amino acid N-acyltransferase YncA